MNDKTEWLDCGKGTLVHPVTGRPVTTRVVEVRGRGRIFEVYDYSNESEHNFQLIMAAPSLFSQLQRMANNCPSCGGSGRERETIEDDTQCHLCGPARAALDAATFKPHNGAQE